MFTIEKVNILLSVSKISKQSKDHFSIRYENLINLNIVNENDYQKKRADTIQGTGEI